VALGAGLEGVLSELRGLTDEQRAALVPQAKPTTNGSGKTRSKVGDINDPAKLEKMIADKRASQNAAAAVEAAKARLEQLKSGIVPTVDPEDELGGEDEGDEDESEE
jgi:outer membrane protein TolC